MKRTSLWCNDHVVCSWRIVCYELWRRFLWCIIWTWTTEQEFITMFFQTGLLWLLVFWQNRELVMSVFNPSYVKRGFTLICFLFCFESLVHYRPPFWSTGHHASNREAGLKFSRKKRVEPDMKKILNHPLFNSTVTLLQTHLVFSHHH